MWQLWKMSAKGIVLAKAVGPMRHVDGVRMIRANPLSCFRPEVAIAMTKNIPALAHAVRKEPDVTIHASPLYAACYSIDDSGTLCCSVQQTRTLSDVLMLSEMGEGGFPVHTGIMSRGFVVAATVRAAVRACRAERVILLGYSLGAAVAIVAGHVLALDLSFDDEVAIARGNAGSEKKNGLNGLVGSARIPPVYVSCMSAPNYARGTTPVSLPADALPPALTIRHVVCRDDAVLYNPLTDRIGYTYPLTEPFTETVAALPGTSAIASHETYPMDDAVYYRNKCPGILI